jgi:hypothetical protein
VIELKEECERLIDDTYDPVVYPNDECRCIYLNNEDGTSTFSHYWTPKQYQMYLDSMTCGYDMVRYGSIDIIRTTVIKNGVTLECDC